MSEYDAAAANMTEEELAQKACMDDRKMGLYVLASVATLAAFLVLVLVPRVLSAPCRTKRNKVCTFVEMGVTLIKVVLECAGWRVLGRRGK